MEAMTSRLGFYSGVATAVVTVVAFGFAIIAIPVSGAMCTQNCHAYPYNDTAAQWPHDFLWMPIAMLAIVAFVALMVSIHLGASVARKPISLLGLGFALISAAVLLIDYYLQFTVVPSSLAANETEGLALLTMYNPNGIFIALEELGYLVMAVSFLCVAPIFAGSRLELAVRWIFGLAFAACVAATVLIAATSGLDRQDRLEIALLSICWLTMIVNGALLAVVFRRRGKEGADEPHGGAIKG